MHFIVEQKRGALRFAGSDYFYKKVLFPEELDDSIATEEEKRVILDRESYEMILADKIDQEQKEDISENKEQTKEKSQKPIEEEKVPQDEEHEPESAFADV